jgi:hypothetical protein
LSQEHPLPRTQLAQFIPDGVVQVHGATFSPTEAKEIPVATLSAGILCKRHNESLSALDVRLARLQRWMEDVDVAVREGTSLAPARLNGLEIERALLKVTIGAVAAGWLGSHSRGTRVDRLAGQELGRWTDVLFGFRRWSRNQGLYLDQPDEAVGAPSHLWLAPISRDGSLAALGVGVRHLLFWVCLDYVPPKAIHRPSSIVHAADGGSASVLQLDWLSEPHGPSASVTRAGSHPERFEYPQPRFK